MKRVNIMFHLCQDIERESLENFCSYFESHPLIWKRFKFYAYEKLYRGRKVGAKAILERLRWDCDDIEKGADGYKVNNLYAKHYARLLTETDPAFDGFFKFRGDK